jgi:hypothetical protein
MALKVTVENAAFPKDHEFEVRGLGLFVNGKTRTITEEEEQTFVSLNGESVKDATKDSEYIKVEGTSEVKVSEVVVETSNTTTEGGES